MEIARRRVGVHARDDEAHITRAFRITLKLRFAEKRKIVG